MGRVNLGFNIDDTAKSLETLLRAVEHEGGARLSPMESSFPEDLTLDLSESQFIGPLGVATLCLLRRLAERNGRTISLLKPEFPRTENYCAYSGLLKEFGVGSEPNIAHPRNVTRPVCWFRDSIPRLEIEALVLLARTKMKLSVAGEIDLKLTLSEVERNVLDHAESPLGGLMSARAFDDKREVRFAVADGGIGFCRALKKRVDTADDHEALRKVFDEKVSSRSRPHNMGQGLQHLHTVVEETHGRLIVYSGNAFIDWGEKDPRRFTLAKAVFPGTIIFVRLPIRDDDEDDLPIEGSFWDG